MNPERPHLRFEENHVSIYSIFQNYPLPVVVQCYRKNLAVSVDNADYNFDLTQPILFYRKRRIQKIPARSLIIDEDSIFQEIGDPLVIPEDYKGYFAIIKKRGISGPADDRVPHYSNIEELAESETAYFLIGGQSRVKAYRVVSRHGEHANHMSRTLFPGEVLKKVKIFVEMRKTGGKLFRKGSLITEKFLSCMDEAEEEVLIPFAETGLFYPLANSSKKVACPVMQMEHIVAQKLLPCVVKLVYGRVPNTSCGFTGLLHLDKSDFQQSIIAATIMNTKNILIEIPTTCEMEFRVAMNNRDLLRHEVYAKAIQLCHEKAQKYMTNIKVSSMSKQDFRTESSSTIASDDTQEHDSELPPIPTACSKLVNRDSGYIPMVGQSRSNSDSVFDEKSDLYVTMGSPSPKSSYMLDVFMQKQPTDEKEDTYDLNSEKLYDRRGSSRTDPPDIPPPPKPCRGSPTQDSGISDTSSQDNRNLPTFTLSEDNTTYDVPRPVRRESAPSSHTDSPHIERHWKSYPQFPPDQENRPRGTCSLAVPPNTLPLRHVHSCSPYINDDGLRELEAKLHRISETRNCEQYEAEHFEWSLRDGSANIDIPIPPIPTQGNASPCSPKEFSSSYESPYVNTLGNKDSLHQWASDTQFGKRNQSLTNNYDIENEDPGSVYSEIQDVQDSRKMVQNIQQPPLINILPIEILEIPGESLYPQLSCELPPEILESPSRVPYTSPLMKELPPEILESPSQVQYVSPLMRELPAEILESPDEIQIPLSVRHNPPKMGSSSEMPCGSYSVGNNVNNEVSYLKDSVSELEKGQTASGVFIKEGNVIGSKTEDTVPCTGDQFQNETTLNSKDGETGTTGMTLDHIKPEPEVSCSSTADGLQNNEKTTEEDCITKQNSLQTKAETAPAFVSKELDSKSPSDNSDSNVLNCKVEKSIESPIDCDSSHEPKSDDLPPDNSTGTPKTSDIDRKSPVTIGGQCSDMKQYRERSKTLWSILRAKRQESTMKKADSLTKIDSKAPEPEVLTRNEPPAVAPKPKIHNKSKTLPRPRRRTTECTISVHESEIPAFPPAPQPRDQSNVENRSVLSSMDVDQLDTALKEVGVKQETREKLKCKQINGRSLLDIISRDALQNEFPDIGRIDLTKITMFVQGKL